MVTDLWNKLHRMYAAVHIEKPFELQYYIYVLSTKISLFTKTLTSLLPCKYTQFKGIYGISMADFILHV